MIMIKAYGVTDQASHSGPLDLALEELRIRGLTVIPGVLSVEEALRFGQSLDAVYELQAKEFGVESLRRIKEQDLARCPLAYDRSFLDLSMKPQVLSLVSRVLGDYFILHLQNGIINQSQREHHQSLWHRDLPYQNFVISSPLAVNAFYCLDDFTEHTGGTYFLPFSHREPFMPSESYVLKHQLSLQAQQGDVILFDSMLFHCAGYNRSGRPRRGLNHVYVKPLLKQQISLPAFLGDDYSDDPETRRFLGYDCAVAESLASYRMKRIQRLN